jgi:hypothetical protein
VQRTITKQISAHGADAGNKKPIVTAARRFLYDPETVAQLGPTSGLALFKMNDHHSYIIDTDFVLAMRMLAPSVPERPTRELCYAIGDILCELNHVLEDETKLRLIAIGANLWNLGSETADDPAFQPPREATNGGIAPV